MGGMKRKRLIEEEKRERKKDKITMMIVLLTPAALLHITVRDYGLTSGTSVITLSGLYYI